MNLLAESFEDCDAEIPLLQLSTSKQETTQQSTGERTPRKTETLKVLSSNTHSLTGRCNKLSSAPVGNQVLSLTPTDAQGAIVRQR